jgi:thioredoxin 1
MLADMSVEYFDQAIQKDKIVLIDFWAEWCGYCRIMEPILQEAAAKYQGKILFYRVRDENVEVAEAFAHLARPPGPEKI